MQRFSRWPSAIAAAALAMVFACQPARPHTYGDSSVLAPQVAGVKGEKAPSHVSVSLAQPANVTVFMIVAGRSPTLLFPSDSTTSEYVDAGVHELPTALLGKKSPLADSAATDRRLLDTGFNRSRANPNRPDTTFRYMNYRDVGYLYVFASRAPIPYSVLASRVAAYTIPANDADALSAVTKLLRDAAGAATPWAAYAMEYHP